ncbi:hypothetical protein C8R47DRAFT_1162952 [Mycena vitilis]|nr:hypothetical protein C8R47DRAFT_1162952 [Mycena vitilis]
MMVFGDHLMLLLKELQPCFHKPRLLPCRLSSYILAYCSSECQRADWTRHKPTCMDIKGDLAGRDIEKEVLKVFKKWSDAWQDPLLIWGIFAANLANQEPDFLANHSYFVRLKRRHRAGKLPASAKYEVLSGIFADTEIVAEFESIPALDLEYRKQLIESFSLGSRPDTLRFIVFVPETELCNWSRKFIAQIFDEEPELGPAKAFTNPLSAGSRLLSTALAQASRDFADHVRNGDTSAHIELLRELDDNERRYRLKDDKFVKASSSDGL